MMEHGLRNARRKGGLRREVTHVPVLCRAELLIVGIVDFNIGGTLLNVK